MEKSKNDSIKKKKQWNKKASGETDQGGEKAKNTKQESVLKEGAPLQIF